MCECTHVCERSFSRWCVSVCACIRALDGFCVLIRKTRGGMHYCIFLAAGTSRVCVGVYDGVLQSIMVNSSVYQVCVFVC